MLNAVKKFVSTQTKQLAGLYDDQTHHDKGLAW